MEKAADKQQQLIFVILRMKIYGGFPGMKDISKIAHNDQIKILFVIE